MLSRCGAALRRVDLALALALLAIGIALVSVFLSSRSTTPTAPAAAQPKPVGVTVTTLLAEAKAGDLRAVRVDERDSTIVATARDRRAPLSVSVPRTYLHDTVASLVAAGVPVGVADPSTRGAWATGGDGERAGAGSSAAQSYKLTVIVPLVLLALLLAFAAFYRALHVRERRRREQRAQNWPVLTKLEQSADQEGATPGPAGSKLTAPAETPDTRFADVAGCDEAIDELTEMVAFLREPERFTRTGAKPPKGALLVGPPGTGKTLLARAVAGEAGVPFFALAGSDFVEKYVGVGAQRVRDLFQAARKCGQAIIFIDEIDAVARRRSGDGEQGNGESENTLIALLAEMDGFTSSGVVVLAATNRADILDPAVTRPGRLDRKIEVPNPDRRGRQRILEVHAAGKPLAANVDLVSVARRTPGFSGAQLAGLVNEACLEAVRRDLDVVDQGCFDHAVATVALGRARTSALVTEHDRRVTAWHEAGHTLAALLLPDADDPVQVTIVPRGPAGGVTWMSGNDDIFLPRRKARAQLVVALAGRAAEEALLDGEYTQGASGDLQSATDLAYRMATQYGMTRLGYQVRHPQHAAGSEAVAQVVEELLAEAHREATALLATHRAFLTAVAESLLEEETLTLAEVRALAAAAPADEPGTVTVPLPGTTALPDETGRPDSPATAGFVPGGGRTRPRTTAAARLRALREQWERRSEPPQPGAPGAADGPGGPDDPGGPVPAGFTAG